MARFITDMGGPLVSTNVETGEDTNIGRYGVWDDCGRKPEVIACGDDLDALQAAYGPDLPVHQLEGVQVDRSRPDKVCF
jgi:hypothetical protein